VTRYLLDVNVLIALIDPAHVQHDRAHDWFAAKGKKAWATCPLTENGVLRIVGHPRYPNSPGTPAAIAELMSILLALGGHELWPDDITLLDNQRIDSTRLLDSRQVTDSYLLALARAHRGQLATFDRRMVTDAVIGGTQAMHRIG
jgi:toxin-antitoxin system PIN domain toxin